MQNSSRDKNLPSTYITSEIHSVLHFKVALEIEQQGEAFNVVGEIKHAVDWNGSKQRLNAK